MQYFIAIRELVPHSIWTFATSTGMLMLVVHPSVSAAAIFAFGISTPSHRAVWPFSVFGIAADQA